MFWKVGVVGVSGCLQLGRVGFLVGGYVEHSECVGVGVSVGLFVWVLDVEMEWRGTWCWWPGSTVKWVGKNGGNGNFGPGGVRTSDPEGCVPTHYLLG